MPKGQLKMENPDKLAA